MLKRPLLQICTGGGQAASSYWRRGCPVANKSEAYSFSRQLQLSLLEAVRSDVEVSDGASSSSLSVWFQMPCSRSSRSQFSDYSLADSDQLQHLLVHHDQGGGEPQCLVWACRACKRMRRVLDRRAMATVRERKRLSKVRRSVLILVTVVLSEGQ